MTKKASVLAVIFEGSTDAHISPSVQNYETFFAHPEFDNKVSIARPEDFLFIMDESGPLCLLPRLNKKIQDFDQLFIRGSVSANKELVYTLSLCARYFSMSCWNGYTKMFARSKLSQAAIMAINSIPTPLTIFSLDKNLLIRAVLDKLAFPVIVKDWDGSRGRNNFLVRSEQELRELLDTNSFIAVAQQFIPNNGDYRYLRMGDEELIIERISSGESHLNNTSQGGTARLVSSDTIPDSIKQKSNQFAAEQELFVYGADIIQDRETGEYYFLEVNWQPQLLSGAFTDEKRAALARAFFGK